MVRARRWASWHGDFPKRRKGDRWLCRWCGAPCPGRRENVCSEPCMREIAIRCWSKALRYYTFERDDGLCERCDLDAPWLRRELDDLRFTDRDAWRVQLRELGFTRKEGLKTLWQADHIEPVSITGPVGLDGIQSLCIRCHKRKTIDDLMPPTKRKKKRTTKLHPDVTVHTDGALTPPQVRAKATRFREKGTWLSGLSVKVEPVKKAHRTACIDCGEMPEDRRMLVKKGAGRSQISEVYCIICSDDFIDRMEMESHRARLFMSAGELEDGGAIRVATEQFEKVKQAHKERAAERKRKREAKNVG